VKVALIGTGFWASTLAGAARRANAVELVSVYSRDEERRGAFASGIGVRAADSFDDALDGVEGVLLATPNPSHEEQAVAAAARGVHVFVEKPIADTLEAGERIRDACARAGVRLTVGHEFRRLGAARRAKELVDSGALGRVVLAEANFSLTSPVKAGSWKAGGRGTPLVQLGVHHADTLAYLLGPIAHTCGLNAQITNDVVDDVGIATLEFENGALGAIVSSYVSPRTYSIRLLGTDAVLDYRTDISVWPAAHRLDELTTLTLGGEQVEFEPRDPLVEELEEFARGDEPETGPAEGLAALRVILEAVA
jgi:predicted dehydrogenase